MTGCGCVVLVAGIVALIVLFVRGSFDAGEPIDTAVAFFAALLLAIEGWHWKWSAHELIRARRA